MTPREVVRVARLALVLTGGCALSSGHGTREPDAFVAPSTDRDPAPFRPRPSAATTPRESDSTLTLVQSTAHEQARTLALRFVRALLDADATALRDLLAEDVTRISAAQRVARDSMVSECLGIAHQLHFRPELRVEDVIVLGELRTGPLASLGLGMPPGLVPSDVSVEVPVRRIDVRGAASPAFYTDLPCISRLVVRPGPYPIVLAVGR